MPHRSARRRLPFADSNVSATYAPAAATSAIHFAPAFFRREFLMSHCIYLSLADKLGRIKDFELFGELESSTYVLCRGVDTRDLGEGGDFASMEGGNRGHFGA